MGGTSDITGVYINKVSDDNFLKLKDRDVLIELEIDDIYSIDNIFNIVVESDNLLEICKKSNKIKIQIDNFGIVKLFIDNKEHVIGVKKKINIK